MKIKTSVPEYPAAFIRRATAWACKAVGVPVRQIEAVAVRKIRGGRGASGRCSYRFGGRSVLTVRIGTKGYPFTFQRNGFDRHYATPVDAFAFVLFHEAAHAWHFWREQSGAARTRGNGNGNGGSERLTDVAADRVFAEFQADRAALLAEWLAAEPERAAKPRPSAVEQRAEKAARMLAAWERRLKLARTKAAKYRRQVKYYERRAAQSVIAGEGGSHP